MVTVNPSNRADTEVVDMLGNRNKKQKRPGTFFPGCHLVLVTLLIAGAAMSCTIHPRSGGPTGSVRSSSPPPESGVSSDSLPALSPAGSSSSLPPAQDGYSYFDDAVFIGDSITVDIRNYELMDNAAIIGSTGASTYTAYTNHQIEIDEDKNTLGWIPGLVVQKHPKKIYMMFGSNDLGWMPRDEYIQYYGSLIDYFKINCSDAILYVQSTLPISAKAENTSGPNGWPFDNAKIDDYNAALRALCTAKGVRYLDVASVIKGPDGKLPADVTDDGVHLKSGEYKKWFTYLLANK